MAEFDAPESEDQQMHHKVANESNPDLQLQSKLLALPAELRNKIYKHCLVIGMDDLEYPTVKKSRDRFDFWYTDNRFHVRIYDYDASLYLAWRRHMNAFDGEFKAQKLYFAVSGDPNWPKLKEWCYAVWSGIPKISDKNGDDDGAEAEIVDAAHRIAYASRRKTWKKCEHQLEGLRKALGQLDDDWLD